MALLSPIMHWMWNQIYLDTTGWSCGWDGGIGGGEGGPIHIKSKRWEEAMGGMTKKKKQVDSKC